MLALVFALFLGVFSQTYDVMRIYRSTADGTSDCITYIALSVTPASGSCTTIACGSSCLGSSCITVACAQSGLPTDLPGSPVVLTSYASTDCSGSVVALQAFSNGACFNDPTGDLITGTGSAIVTCGNQAIYGNGLVDCTPSGNVTATATYNNGCNQVSHPGVSSQYQSCPKCFHKDTVVQYNGETLSLAQIKQGHKSCVVPHEYTSSGVKITTSCEGVLRVTGEHLVQTQRGLVFAESILVGDFLYQSFDEKQVCEVKTVEQEKNQEYFALNCEESMVLANGYKTSTFGLTHELPAFWMKVATKMVGVEKASAWGDVLSSVFSGLF